MLILCCTLIAQDREHGVPHNENFRIPGDTAFIGAKSKIQAMFRRKKLALALGGVLFLAAGCAGFLWYEATHLRIGIKPEQLAEAEVALKGSLGMAIFKGSVAGASIPGAGPGPLLHGPASPSNKGLIEDYKKNPEEYRRYAGMLDTALDAKEVGRALLRLSPGLLPADSSRLDMQSPSARDAWGDPFCIVPLSGRIAVVSGGPSKISCTALPLTRGEIAQSRRSIFAGPKDIIVVIVSHP